MGLIPKRPHPFEQQPPNRDIFFTSRAIAFRIESDNALPAKYQYNGAFPTNPWPTTIAWLDDEPENTLRENTKPTAASGQIRDSPQTHGSSPRQGAVI
jgi:hypothetical protein